MLSLRGARNNGTDTEVLALVVSWKACHIHQGLLGASACCAMDDIPSLFLFSLRLVLPKLSRLALNSYVTQAELKLANPLGLNLLRSQDGIHVPPDKDGFLVCILPALGNRTLGQGKENADVWPRLPNLLPFALASNGPEPLVNDGSREPAPSPKPPHAALSPGFSSRS